jgi:STE24 endopeptidase
MSLAGRVTASLLLLCSFARLAVAQATPPAPAASVPAPATAETGPSSGPTLAFDPEAATREWLAKVPAADKARSDAYFEGGYWLQLWGLLYGLGVGWLLLGTGISRRLRELAERTVRFDWMRASRFGWLRTLHSRWLQKLRFFWLQTVIYALGYILLTTALGFPLGVYTGFLREHSYGLSNQTFGQWLSDEGKGLGIGLAVGAVGITLLYAVLRRAPRTWWVWGAVVAVALLAVVVVIAPVYIEPLFNEYTRLEDPKIRDPILLMAQANGVPAHDVWVVDASRQSKRISANVSGFLGTERIALNDNLLRRCTPAEIEAVMGHELGHYVLNHVYEDFVNLGLVILLGFAFVHATFEKVRSRWGARWGVAGVEDPAGLPLLVALLAVAFFVMTPLANTIIRSAEAEADAFGLNTAQQPDGFASVALKLGEYRKLDPGPIEELIFFDHPSGRNRILRAMRWKAAHAARGSVGAGATSPPSPSVAWPPPG